MGRYILRRILLLIPVVLGVAILIFTLMYISPGDPVQLMLGDASPVEVDAAREAMGYNDPYLVQLGRFLRDTFLRFDFGTSLFTQQSVMQEIAQRLPNTLIIALFCMVIQIVVAVPLGIAAATHRGKWQDYLCMILAMVGVAVPEFIVGLLLLLAFALRLHWLPMFGIRSWKGFILPIISASLPTLGSIARQTRSQMLEVIRSDYLLTARMKGVSERAILYEHALPNALIPVITSIGTSFGRALGGTVVVETVFSVPGMGSYMIEAINTRNYPSVRASVMVFAVMFTLVMLLVDLAYAFINPRIKAKYQGEQKRRVKKHA